MSQFSSTVLEFETAAETAEPSIEPVNADDRAAANARRYIAFKLGVLTYCIDTDFVAEVTGPLRYTFLPNAPAAIAGIAPHRGEMIAIVDLRDLLHQGKPGTGSRPKFILLESGISQTRLAFEVDRIRETMEAAESDFEKLDKVDLADAYLQLPNDRIHRIDPRAVYAALG